ncbi:hypothetical protein Cgig2_029013 [Carnegiea gigantea]|uniref:Uncharacterized protein n=1 Tax=Carnegiea gigantea TaxID=171969 RepID=A0A9Q1JW87_9CARY|nr:hypothetical protein Cgig2_029013 [Carnegiea gigantea]
MWQLSKVALQKVHVSNVEFSYNSDSEENDPTYECKEANHNDGQIEAKEKVAIHKSVKPARKKNKHSLQSKGDGAALVLELRALKFEQSASEKRMYQKAFIMRMTTRSFLFIVAQLNEAQIEAIRSMGFTSFLKVNLKWAKVFGHSMQCVYDPGGPKDHYCSKSILKFIKDVSQIFVLDKLITSVRHYKESTTAKGDKAGKDSGAPSFNPTLPLHKLDSEDQISRTTLVTDASITVEREDHYKDVVLDQLNNGMKKDDNIPSCSLSQSTVPYITSMPDPNTAAVNEDDGGEDDDNGAPLRFPLRNASQVNCELSIKKSTENKLQRTGVAKKDDEKRVGAIRTPEKLEEVGEDVKMNLINIWPNILNDRERERDLATPSRLFMSCDQSVSVSQSTYYSIITTLVIIPKTLSYLNIYFSKILTKNGLSSAINYIA